jgi:cytoskeletal protein CcmA (bactofilin family)
MKYRSITFGLAALLLVMTTSTANAAEVRSGASASVGAGEVVDDDLFASGDAVTIAGRVTGDAYAIGQTVLVSGTVDGDLIAAAEQVVVDGTVRGDVRAGGARVTVNGVVERNVTGLAQQVDVRTNGRVGGSVLAAAQSVGTFGSVGRGMAVAAENLQIGGPVGGEVLAGVGNLTVTPSARIEGELDYHANRQADIPAGTVSGPIRFTQNEDDRAPQQQEFLNGLFDLGGLVLLFGQAVLGAVLLILAPRLAARAMHAGRQQPLPSVGLGLGALILTPIVAIIVAVTLVGIPLSFVLFALYVVAVIVAWPAAGLLVGGVLADWVRRPMPTFAILVVGLIALHIVTHVPFIGWLFGFAALALGLGMLVLTTQRSASGQGKLAATL